MSSFFLCFFKLLFFLVLFCTCCCFFLLADGRGFWVSNGVTKPFLRAFLFFWGGEWYGDGASQRRMMENHVREFDCVIVQSASFIFLSGREGGVRRM